MKQRNRYYSKILLFGEYSILIGSKALSIPYTHFQGELSFINDNKYTDIDFARISNNQLAELYAYMQRSDALGNYLDIPAFADDIQKGLYFESTIPQSYGLGSSGALCAALYSQYALDKSLKKGKIEPEQIPLLRSIFKDIESFFHGKSSGIDPLSCYLKSPLLIESIDRIQPISIPRAHNDSSSGIFLIDSGKPGKTEPLVTLFLEKFQPNGVLTSDAKKLISLTNSCIDSITTEITPSFWARLADLSIFQRQVLESLIPDTQRELWDYGNATNLFNLKLCGSGGGGFLIGFARNYAQAQIYLQSQGVQNIPVYLSEGEKDRF